MFTRRRWSSEKSSILFVLLGALCIVLGTVLGVIHFTGNAKRTQEVQATVTGYTVRESGRATRRHNTYAPNFEYEFEGVSYTYISDVSTNKKSYAVGESVTLKIDPNDPSDAYDPNESKPIMIIAILGFGVVMIVAGILFRRGEKNK